MARARYNWKALFLEYNQGRYKSMTEFAEKKNLSYDVVRKRFKELRKESGISKPEPKPDERPHAWQNLKSSLPAGLKKASGLFSSDRGEAG
jgi:DNA-binding Lrp family transcriptional regulator